MKVTLLEYFEETIQRKKDEIAVVEGDERVSFQQLRQMACGIAGALAQVIEPVRSAPVAVFIPKSIWCVAADLGILYSGNAYMNLDIKTPSSRIQNILNGIKPEAILTLKQYKEKLPEYSGEIICVDELDININCNDFSELRKKNIIDTDPMCLINTSGSTGTPKGVVLNHRSFIDFTQWSLETFDFDGEEIIG